MKHKFKEADLDPNFCKTYIEEIKKLIDNSQTFTVVGIPGMGISMFLKYLSCLEFAHFIHVDINDLSSLNKFEFFKLLFIELGGISKDQDINLITAQITYKLKELTEEYSKVVIVFNRFDRLSPEFNQNFFANLRSLRDINKEKIVMIFAANIPLIETNSEYLNGGNLNMYSTNFYLSLYSPFDLKALIKLNNPSLLNHSKIDYFIDLSGGHYQLLMLLLNSMDQNPLDDLSIKFQIKEVYEYLNYSRKKQLQNLSLGKKVSHLDNYLFKTGFVKDNLKLFSPLMEQYIKSVAKLKLPVKEELLFMLLKKNLGKVVSKEEIFNLLWKDLEGSDWALNALIYRLRKNPTFQSHNYLIESYKKVGYRLIKN